MPVLDDQIAMLDRATAPELRGTVTDVRGLAIHAVALPVPVGSTVTVHTRLGGKVRAEVVGFDSGDTILLPLAPAAGVARGDAVVAEHAVAALNVGEALLGRVINGLGEPIDGRGPVPDVVWRPLDPAPLDPLQRRLIEEPLATGVRAIDAMTPLGRGQRIGIFAAPGVGKSTLLAQCAKKTAADVSVIALIGERGREVGDFIEKTLGPEGMARSVVVVATGDEPALVRIRAAKAATTVAEFFRDRGADVLLVVDSVTRFCQAQRQVGLAAGEPPATKGYPPSVFSMLPNLMERAGNSQAGSITGLYSVLVEGEDMAEPIADACRGILDGHVQLDRKLAERGHYPAIDVVSSISRVANDVTDAEHRNARQTVIKLLAAYREVEDLLNIGAYAAGSNPDFDLAIACKPALDQLLQQGSDNEPGDFGKTRAQLMALLHRIGAAQQELSKGTRPNVGPPRPGM